MKELKYLLVTDGSSDRALKPVLRWILEQHLPDCAIEDQWADPYQLPSRPNNPSDNLRWRIEKSLQLYDNPDVLFIHRDAENQSRQQREDEIAEALTQITGTPPPPVCIIPVRMLETWLLIDEAAIRSAAGNPNGRVKLQLPQPKDLEALAEPKNYLYDLLERASELHGRRLKTFRPKQRIHRLAELIEDFGKLRNLPAFQLLESDIQNIIEQQGWNN